MKNKTTQKDADFLQTVETSMKQVMDRVNASKTTQEAKDLLATVPNIPNLVEPKMKRLVDCAFVLTTCDLWDCWDERDDMTVRDDATASTCRDDSTYRSGDASTNYSCIFDDASYFTCDDESLYSRYSRCTQDTTAEDSQNMNVDGDDIVDKEEDEEFEKIMEALKKHAASLGISELELLERLETQQEESHIKEVKPHARLATVQEAADEESSASNQAVQSLKEDVAKESEKTSAKEKATGQPDRAAGKRHLGRKRDRFNFTRRKRDFSRKLLRNVNVASF